MIINQIWRLSIALCSHASPSAHCGLHTGFCCYFYVIFKQVLLVCNPAGTSTALSGLGEEKQQQHRCLPAAQDTAPSSTAACGKAKAPRALCCTIGSLIPPQKSSFLNILCLPHRGFTHLCDPGFLVTIIRSLKRKRPRQSPYIFRRILYTWTRDSLTHELTAPFNKTIWWRS